jgi:hypothetical protein
MEGTPGRKQDGLIVQRCYQRSHLASEVIAGVYEKLVPRVVRTVPVAKPVQLVDEWGQQDSPRFILAGG